MVQFTPRRLASALVRRVVVLLLIGFVVGPFIWMLLTAVKTPDEVIKVPPVYVPSKVTLANFRYFLDCGALGYGLNSVVVTLLTLLLTYLLVIPAAYACSRYKFGLKPYLLVFLVCTQMFPGILLVVPMYKTMNALGLLNTYFSLVIANTTVVLPFSILILITFLNAVPRDLDEAALVDGASRIQVITRVILPVAVPGIIAVSVYCIIYSWNEYMFALTFITRDSLKTLQIGLAGMQSQYLNTWAQIMAGSTMTMFPILILFFLAQRYLVSGLTAGSVKG